MQQRWEHTAASRRQKHSSSSVCTAVLCTGVVPESIQMFQTQHSLCCYILVMYAICLAFHASQQYLAVRFGKQTQVLYAYSRTAGENESKEV